MAKKQKKNANKKAPISSKSAFLSIIPVACAILLIAVVGLVIVLVGNANDKKPTFAGAEDTYFEYGDIKVSKDELYTNMKIEYGAAELVRLIDEKIYANELKPLKEAINDKAKYTAEEKLLVEYILNSLFQIELSAKEKDAINNATNPDEAWEDAVVKALEKELEDNQEAWEELIDSLKMNNLLSDSQIDSNKVEEIESSVWNIVKGHYALQYVRNVWAKADYIEKYKAEKDAANEKAGVAKGTYFTDKEFETQYEADYQDTIYALFIPFTSEAAAKEMMKKYGINTQSSTSINQNGWIKAGYDYNSNDNKADFKMSNEEVLNALYGMYNEVLSYYNDGKAIIDVATDVDNSFNYSLAFNKAVYDLSNKLEDLTVSGNVTLPTVIKVVDGTDVNIVWEIKSNEYVKLENNVLSLLGTEKGTEGKFELTATFTCDIMGTNEKGEEVVKEPYKATKTYKLDSEVLEAAKDEEIKVEDIVAEKKLTLSLDFMKKFTGQDADGVNQFSKFAWTESELKAIDSKLATYLKADGTLEPVYGNDSYADFYKSYTVAPIKGSNYTFLMIKFTEEKAPELETVKAKLEESLFKGLETDNNISKSIYERRVEAGLKIYDKYLEALYDYEYTTFFESTLKLSNYAKFKDSKKNQKEIVASFTVDGQTQNINAEELYKALEEKYGVSVVVDYMNAYLTVGNKEFNPYYNPFTGETYNEEVVKELLNSEVKGFRNNFENDYFMQSFMTYYGFIPNFPGSYGWNDFRKDYFGSYSDRDLLTSGSFGGYVYSNALDLLKEHVYLNDEDHKALGATSYDELLAKLVAKEIENIKDEYYSLNVLNLIVSIDTNYDGTYDNNYVNVKDADGRSEDDVWTDELEEQAVALAKLLFEKAPETLKDSFSNQLTQIVLEYNEAGLEDETWGEYKKLGLVVKFETVNTYTNSSSLVEEFLDELQKIWDSIPEDLIGKTLDAPIYSAEPFETSYGYHHIAVTGSTEMSTLPEEEAQLAIYAALLKYNEVKDSTYTFLDGEKESTKAALEELLKQYGYNLDLAKDLESADKKDANKLAELATKHNVTVTDGEYLTALEAALAESKADFLEKYGFTIDTLAFNEATTKLLGTFYDAAVKEIESGDEMTKYTISVLREFLASEQGFTAENDARKAQLEFIVDFTEEQLKENSEAEEGENE